MLRRHDRATFLAALLVAARKPQSSSANDGMGRCAGGQWWGAARAIQVLGHGLLVSGLSLPGCVGHRGQLVTTAARSNDVLLADDNTIGEAPPASVAMLPDVISPAAAAPKSPATAIVQAADETEPTDQAETGESAEPIRPASFAVLAEPPMLDADESANDDLPPRPVLVEFGEILSIAAGRNPQINFANERIREAFADLTEAESLWLPAIRLGANYHYRDGTIQNTQGEMLDSSRNGMFAGLGARAVGGGSIGIPGIWAQFHLADAVFRPRQAERTYGARRWDAEATQNDMLLEVALAYLQLLSSLQEEAIAAATFENADRLAQLCAEFAESGLTPLDNSDRAATERAQRVTQLMRAREGVRVASAELVRLMSANQELPLAPRETGIAPVELVQPETPLRRLIATGLSQRPELQANRSLVGEAVQRLNRERYAPLLPSLLLGVSYGGMGGGQGNFTGSAGDRLDFDAGLFWELRQFGVGDLARRDQARSRLDQSRWQQVQLMDLVAREITAAHAQVQTRRQQIEVAQAAVEFAVRSYRRNRQRIREGEGLPIEVLQSIQALDAARREYLQVLVDYNEAQFQLFRAIGWRIDEASLAGQSVSTPAEPWQRDALVLPTAARDAESLPLAKPQHVPGAPDVDHQDHLRQRQDPE